MQVPKTGFTVTRSLAMNQSNGGALIGQKGFLLGKIIRLKSDTLYFLGRDSSQCDVEIKGDKVSRVHCSIIFNSKTYDYIVNDCSTNGVVVNEKYKLKKGADTSVKPGSTLLIGSEENQIRLG
ncbi:MAG: FHA domain-containing protein [Clostridium sp.]|nr:FHA domain-containing protein [Clostridium sp.]MCM1171268.1 FHA domain-containing protein [Clostridium sp.]MCM1207462.1 FHA domain-containing protein [Ruminococcus sp.]